MLKSVIYYLKIDFSSIMKRFAALKPRKSTVSYNYIPEAKGILLSKSYPNPREKEKRADVAVCHISEA